MARRITAGQRAEVTKRARNRCEYCLSPGRYATQELSVEHIHPRQKGGANDSGNLALACQGCNGHKATRTTGVDPFTERRVPLYHPRQQLWDAHFAWSASFTHIVGLTPTGRATIHALQLNREGVVNLREVLYFVEHHPAQESDEGHDD